MLEFGRCRDGEEAEAQTQGRHGPTTRSAAQSSTGGGAQGEASQDASASTPRGAAGSERGSGGNLISRLFDALRRISGREGCERDEELERQIEALDLRVAELENAQRDGNAALAAAPLRMLLIDAAYQVIAIFAQDLETMLRSSELRGENFLAVLRRLLPETRYRLARDYLAMLFDARRSDAELGSGNPLEQIEVMVPGPDGTTAPRVLSFGFRRVPNDDRVLVWIDDVTERLRRQQAARAADATKAKQLDILLEIVHLPREALDRFESFARQELKAIDAALRAGAAPLTSSAEVFRERVEEISGRVGAIERRAEELSLEYFARCAGVYRRKVAELSSRQTLGGDDFLGLVMEQSALRAELDDLWMLRRRLAAPPSPSASDLVAEIGRLAARLASATQKEVVIDADGFEPASLPPERRALVKDVLEELIRNAVVHGIEPPAERVAAGKPRAGRLEIRPTRGAPPQAFAFRFRDDGRGIDITLLRERAVARGVFGDDPPKSLDQARAAALVFAPELSCGLNGIKRRVVDECGGSISVDSEAGAYCEFSFVIPGSASMKPKIPSG